MHKLTLSLIAIAFCTGLATPDRNNEFSVVDPGATLVDTAMRFAPVDLDYPDLNPPSKYVYRLRFAPGSATLYSAGKLHLDPLINDWKSLGAVTIEAIGYTSTNLIPEVAQTTYTDNYALSLARAQVVADYLREQLAVSQRDLVVIGRGPDEPLASNSDTRGQEFNERIEIRIGLAPARYDPPSVVATEALDESVLAAIRGADSNIAAANVEIFRPQASADAAGTGSSDRSTHETTGDVSDLQVDNSNGTDSKSLVSIVTDEAITGDTSSEVIDSRGLDADVSRADSIRRAIAALASLLPPDDSLQIVSAALSPEQALSTTERIPVDSNSVASAAAEALRDRVTNAGEGGSPEVVTQDSPEQRAGLSNELLTEVGGGTQTTAYPGGIVESAEQIFEPLLVAEYSGVDVTRSAESAGDVVSAGRMDLDPRTSGQPRGLIRGKTLSATGWTSSLGGWIGTAYNSNVFEKPSAPTSSGLLDTAVRGEIGRRINRANQVAFWAGATAAPQGASDAPDAFRGVIGTAFRHRLSNTVLVSLVAEGMMENDDVVNKEGEDPLREFAHSSLEMQPSAQFRTRNNSLISINYVIERRNFREQEELNSLDWWQHGPSVKLRSPVGNRGTVEVDYAFRMQSYDEELASLRTGKDQDINPKERHRFDRVEFDAFFRPSSKVELLAGYCLERKEDSYVGFESWTNHCLRSGANARLGNRVTVRSVLSYDKRAYDNRRGDDGEKLSFSRITAEASLGYRLSGPLTLFGSVWTANRTTNRTTGDDFLDVGVFRMSTGLSFAY